MARQVLENGVILPAEYSDDWYDDMTSNLTKLDDVIGSDSEKLSSADVGAAALSNNYNDLDNLPTIPTVNDATLTIQKNGVDVQTFTANASSNVTCNITVPTKTSDLTNDSNFVDTSNPVVSSGITSAKVTDYDTHIADTDKHVTTADKNRWNNQTYVFRYSSTALTASSTNSNTLLDNTDNLKVGDKVIDSSGVLFSITAIDTQNSTFTIGTALVDLAQDSDVVHKSGDETISGVKSFINYFLGKDLSGQTVDLNDCVDAYGGAIHYYYAVSNYTNISNKPENKPFILESKTVRYVSSIDYIYYQKIYTADYNATPSIYTRYYRSGSASWSNWIKDTNKFVTTDTTQTISGNKTFSSINGVEPSSLSLPSDRSARIDISSYITNLGNGDNNQYIVPANGYIWLHFTSINSALCYSQTSGGLTTYAQTFARYSGDGQLYAFFPVRKNDYFIVQIYTASTAVVQNAYFIPCQGNV